MPKKTEKWYSLFILGCLVKNQSPFLELRNEDDSMEFISNQDYGYYLKRFDAEYVDISYSRFGTIGIAKLINSNRKLIASYNIVLIKPDDNLVIPLFLI